MKNAMRRCAGLLLIGLCFTAHASGPRKLDYSTLEATRYSSALRDGQAKYFGITGITPLVVFNPGYAGATCFISPGELKEAVSALVPQDLVTKWEFPIRHLTVAFHINVLRVGHQDCDIEYKRVVSRKALIDPDGERVPVDVTLQENTHFFKAMPQVRSTAGLREIMRQDMGYAIERVQEAKRLLDATPDSSRIRSEDMYRPVPSKP